MKKYEELSIIEYILENIKMTPVVCLFSIIIFQAHLQKYLLEIEQKGEREISICCSTYSCILQLFLLCALTGNQSHNLGTLGLCSKQVHNLARATEILLKCDYQYNLVRYLGKKKKISTVAFNYLFKFIILAGSGLVLESFPTYETKCNVLGRF